MRCAVAFLILLAAHHSLFAQAADPADGIYSMRADIQPPRIKHKVDPVYSAQAKDAYIQGTCVYEIIIGTNGRVTEATLISPLGFGLDEKALEAVNQWEFKPGTRNGVPVKVRAMVELNFIFPTLNFDRKAEDRRTSFNLALLWLARNTPADTEKAEKAIQKLSKENFPAAQYLHSRWLAAGEHGPQDTVMADELLRKAADKNYGPALYEAGRQMTKANPNDEKGWQLIRDASTLGSIGAQFYLGRQAETSTPNPDLDRARRYYRLCAAQGDPSCQFNLANLLLEKEDRTESERVQGVAWLQLASEKLERAKPLWERERTKLSGEQQIAATKLSTQLLTRR